MQKQNFFSPTHLRWSITENTLQIIVGFFYFLFSEMNLSESFRRQSVEHYGAEPTKLLASSEENMRMINGWVANKTNNKITSIIDDLSPNTQLILLNAVSFSGQ